MDIFIWKTSYTKKPTDNMWLLFWYVFHIVIVMTEVWLRKYKMKVKSTYTLNKNM